ncbi:MAG TPA: type II secretion system protein GspK, partial [Phenylobacterium sp.]|nr:type II secretion system protein GspK [Phenylobacterium sp.]
SRLSPVNVNALSEADAVLVTMLTEGRASVAAGRQLIARRPSGGWSQSDFWMDPLVKESLPADPSQIAVRPAYLTLQTEVTHLDAEVTASGLLEVDPSGQVRLVARRWTLDE